MKCGELIARVLRAGYINANVSAKKNVKITADVQQKTWATVKKAYTWSKKMMTIFEVNFCENKIVKNQLFFLRFPGFEEYRKFMVKKTCGFHRFSWF